MPLRKGSWRCRQSLSRAGERMARSFALGAASGRVFTCVGDVSTRHHAKKPWKSPPREGRRAGGCTTCGQLLLVRARPGLSKALYLGLEGKAKKKSLARETYLTKLCGEASAGEAPACLLGVVCVQRTGTLPKGSSATVQDFPRRVLGKAREKPHSCMFLLYPECFYLQIVQCSFVNKFFKKHFVSCKLCHKD